MTGDGTTGDLSFACERISELGRGELVPVLRDSVIDGAGDVDRGEVPVVADLRVKNDMIPPEDARFAL